MFWCHFALTVLSLCRNKRRCLDPLLTLRIADTYHVIGQWRHQADEYTQLYLVNNMNKYEEVEWSIEY